MSMAVDANEIVVRIIKYVLEGAMVAIAVKLIPSGQNIPIDEVLIIALIAAATFSLLDMFAPSIGSSARMGAGFGIGAGIAGWPARAI